MNNLYLTLSNDALISFRIRENKTLFNKLQNVLPKYVNVCSSDLIDTMTCFDGSTYAGDLLEIFDISDDLIIKLNMITHRGVYVFNHIFFSIVQLVDVLSGNNLTLMCDDINNVLSDESKSKDDGLIMLIAIHNNDTNLDGEVDDLLDDISQRRCRCVIWGDYTIILTQISLKEDNI